VLLQTTLTATGTTIDLNSLPAGVYVLKLQNGEVLQVIKE